ncbi:MAG: triose-phosphate isomerase [candidate division WOR-3 bacterium]
MRRLLFAGNWKMYKPPSEAAAFAAMLKERVPAIPDREVVVFPPMVSLPAVASVLAGSTIIWGAQNVHWEQQGAFTGETSPLFLVDLNCQYVLVGHSERRLMFAEDDVVCNRKIRAAQKCGLRPILCCGETKAQRKAGQTFDVISAQLREGLTGAELNDQMIIAYEPVWAIGTGSNATPAEAAEVHRWIRSWLGSAGTATRIIYGGSVSPDNIDLLLAEPEIDGVLVGSASLDVSSFTTIVSSVRKKCHY